jgi:rfaE bifunctional protein nucleotidyltransferase chain/domain
LIIWTNGCFDIIHPGHIQLFKFAKSKGSKLIVGLDTDERVRLNKGRNRPINCLEDRVEVVSSIKYVDEVVTFGTDEQLVQRILESKAGLIVIGSDYRDKKIIGSELARVELFERIPGKSTSETIHAIRV